MAARRCLASLLVALTGGVLAVTHVAAQDSAPVVVDLWCCGHSSRSGDTYGLGEILKAEVIFSEAVTVTGTPQLTLTIGSATRTVDLEYVWEDGEGLVFEYEVQSDDLDTDGISIEADALSLNGATIQDSAGNPAELGLGEHAIIDAGDHKVDGSIDHPPVVKWVYVEKPVNGDTLGLGETIEVHVGFNEPIEVTGTPQLTLNIDAATRVVDLGDVCCDDGMDHLKFYYEVQADDRDADGISIAANALSLNGGTIRDSGGNDAVLDLGEHVITNNADHKVDGSIDNPPAVEWAGVVSEPQSGDTYAVGEEITIDVNFNELVTVTGTPQLELTIGTATRTVDLNDRSLDEIVRGIGFTYQVQAEDRDTDGISVAADALKLNGGTIQDRGGNDAELGLGEHAFTNDGNHTVDGSIDNPPVVEWAGFHSEPGSGDTYGIGEAVKIGINYNEPVVGIGTPQLEMNIGAVTRTVDLDHWSDEDEGPRFRYVVQADDLDGDGISIAANALKLNGATIKDSGGNDAVLDLGEYAIVNDGNHTVDGSIDNPPVVEWAGFHSEPGSGDTYGIGEAVKIGINYNEPVVGIGTPQLEMNIGAVTRTVDLDHWSDEDEGPRFRYVVQADDLDGDGISIAANALKLNGATIKDSGGNDAVLDLGEYAIVNDGNHKVDGSIDNPPVVNDVHIWPEPQSEDTYAVGERIGIGIGYSEPLVVTGTPQLTLTIGTAARTAEFTGVWEEGDGFRFTYEVQADDLDGDGISIAPDALKLNGATIQDRGGNPAELDLGERAIIDDGRYKVDGSIDHPPMVSDVHIWSVPQSGGTYAVGERIGIGIGYSEPLVVTGTPQLTLTIGTAARTAEFTGVWEDSGDGFGFTYEVQADDLDRDGISIEADALKLNGATIQDRGGNPAELGLREHAISNDGNHKVDGSIDHPPMVTWAEVGSGPYSGDTYAVGERIYIHIGFNEPLIVTGTPQLTLTIGPAMRSVRLRDVHDNRRGLFFAYTVQADDLDRDGISIEADALKLNGATIQDRGGNPAELGLREHAISNDGDHKVDGSIDNPPVVEGVCCLSEPQSGDTFSLGETIEIHVEFAEAVTVTGTPQVMLTLSDTERRVMDYNHTCCGSRALIFYYEVQSSDRSPDGLSVSADALILNGGTIQDAGGKDAVLDLGEHEYTAPDPRRKVDGSIVTAPKVRNIYFADHRLPAVGDSYELGEPIEVHVEFDKSVTKTGTPQLALTVGTQTRQMICDFLWRDRWLFCEYRVQATDRDEDGVSVAADSLALNDGTIKFAGDGTTDADLRHDPLPDDSTRKVDGSQVSVPTVSEVIFESSPANGDAYELGELIEVRVRFDRDMNVVSAPQLALIVGTKTRQMSSGSSGLRDRLYFIYTVQETDRDADGVSIPADSLHGGTVTHPVDSTVDADLTHEAVADDPAQRVDGSRVSAPTVTEVSLIREPASGTYKRGETVSILVYFDKPVAITGTPQLALTIGTRTRQSYYSASFLDDKGLFFQYVVQAEDHDADGISIAANSFDTGDGTITLSGHDDIEADLSHHEVADNPDYKVDGSSVSAPPTVDRVSFNRLPTSGGTYEQGETVEVLVDFDKAVAVTGTPRLALTIGTQIRHAMYHRTAYGRTLHFHYTVQAGDSDEDGISIAANALDAGDGAITLPGPDALDADLSHDALSDDPAHKVDAGPQIGCKQPGVRAARVQPLPAEAAQHGAEGQAHAFELALELEENRDGSTQAVQIGCVALAAADRRFSYEITDGNDDSRFAVGTSDGMLSYVGSGEDAEVNSQHLLTVSAAPQDGGETIAIEVRIAIANVDDHGVVTLSTMEPSLGDELTARLHDQDAGVRDQSWQWRRKAPDGAWTAIEGATAAGYTPVAADAGAYLQARVTYVDEHGSQRAESEPTDTVGLAPDRRTRMLQLGLTGFGRSVATTAVNVIGQRFAAAAAAAGEVEHSAMNLTLNRRLLHLPDSGDVAARDALLRSLTEALGVRVTADGAIDFDPVSGAQLLSESAFSMERSHGGGRWGLWGSGDVSGFSGDVDGFKQDATVISGYLGVDYRFVPNGLAGLAASYSHLDLTSESEVEGEATLTGYLINAYPYGFWMPEAWLGLWGLAGFGTGEAELMDLGVTLEGDLRMWLGAMGQRVELLSAGGLSLAVKSDGFITGLTSGGELPQVDVNAWRARLLLEGGLQWRPGDSRLAASVELGGRLDGGDAEQGLGAEGGAALSYTHTGSGLGITGRGRLLLVHEDTELHEWGASAILSWAPPGPGSGLTVSLAPVWGEPTSGVQALWQNRELVLAGGGGGAPSGERASWLPHAVDLKVSYGLGLPHGAGRVAPFAEIQFEDTAARRLRAGATVELSAPEAAHWLHLEAFGERAASRDAATYQFGIGGTVEY